MKALNRLAYISLAASIMFMSSCSEDEDTNSPSIDNYTVNGVELLGIVQLLAGEDLVVVATVNEDIELASYRIQVVADFTTSSATPFSFDQEYAASGLTASVNESIMVPANAIGGPYKVIITATDAADRVSGEFEIDVNVISPTQAVINLTDPLPGVTHSLAFGDTIFLTGTVTDETDLTRIEIIVEPEQMEGGLTAAGGPFYDVAITIGGTSDTTYDLSGVAGQSGHIVVPSGITTGQYGLTIRAIDSHENVAVESITYNLF